MGVGERVGALGPAVAERAPPLTYKEFVELHRGGKSVDGAAEADAWARAYGRMVAAHHPALLAELEAATRRSLGVWIGTGMSEASILGGIAALMAPAPAAIAVALFSFGATCMGATFAAMTGGTVRPPEFVRAQEVAGDSPRTRPFGEAGGAGGPKHDEDSSR